MNVGMRGRLNDGRMRALLLVLCVMTGVLSGALAAAGGPVEIPFEKFTLDNGLTVVVHTDRKAPSVAVNLWYHVGSKNEPAGRTGFAHLFEHLMVQGTENYDDEYYKPIELVGGTSINVTTSSRSNHRCRQRNSSSRHLSQPAP